jgi:hypothetical protein
MENSSSETALSPWKMGWVAARANLVPGLVLAVAAVLLLVTYYSSEPLRETLSHVAELKKQWGPLYTFISAGTFCGVIPWLFRMAIPSLRPTRYCAELLFGILYWGSICQTTDQFYQFQARLWDGILGVKDANDWYVVLLKTACDMLIFTPIIAAPCNSISHLWKDRNFSFSATREALRGNWYRNVALPSLVPNWMVWTPGIATVYALPSLLQVPAANLVGCFWALLCITIAAKTKKPQ